MESGIVFDLKRFATNDGPGIRTVVFLKGCPLSCQWCHNPEGIDSHITSYPKTYQVDGQSYTTTQAIGYTISTHELLAELLKDRIFMEESEGGVTFSGGEPLLQPKFLLEMLQLLSEQGVHTAVDTSGFASWSSLESILPYTKLLLFDIKCIDTEKHVRMTGVSNSIILQNLRTLADLKIPIHIRIPVIPHLNYNNEEMEQIARLCSSLPNIARVDLLPYHKIAQAKYQRLGMQSDLLNEPSLSVEEVSLLTPHFTQYQIPVSIGG